jgi:hypothetical protein
MGSRERVEFRHVEFRQVEFRQVQMGMRVASILLRAHDVL